MAQESQSIKMLDGREVKFGAKQLCQKQVLRANDSSPLGVRFDFRNGWSVSLRIEDLEQATREELIAHGIKQKVGDEGAREKVTTAEEFFKYASAMVDRLKNGQWKQEERVTGVSQADRDLAQAVATIKAKQVDEILEWLKSKTKAEKDALRELAQIKTEISKILAKRAEGIDASGLLNSI